jgi:hypothetical protein
MAVGWVFRLAVFCDEMKKKHKLEAVLNSIAAIGVVSEVGGDGSAEGSASDERMRGCKEYTFEKC